MTDYNSPHEVRDEAKLKSMIKALRAGGELPPIIVCGGDAFTGSHRMAAWDACEMDASVVELTEKEFMQARTISQGYDPLDFNDSDDIEFYHKHVGNLENYDYNEFCEALLKTSQNPEVINAVKDQVA